MEQDTRKPKGGTNVAQGNRGKPYATEAQHPVGNKALQRVYEGDSTTSRQTKPSVYDRVGASRRLAGKTSADTET